jgi:group I intron endonuclease
MATTARRGVYAIENILDGRRYIGSSVNVERRWIEHQQRLVRGAHQNGRLQRAWQEHGLAGFRFVLLEEVADRSDLIWREQVHIDATPDRYNICEQAGCPPLVRSPVHRARVGAALAGRVFSADTLARMSSAQRRRAAEGRMPPITPERRLAQSLARKGQRAFIEKAIATVAEANRRRVWSDAMRDAARLRMAKRWSADRALMLSIQRPQAPLSDEQRRRISARLTGRIFTAAQREAMSRAARARAPKTHCKHGHPFDLVNTHIERNGSRKCRTCDRVRHQCRYRKVA